MNILYLNADRGIPVRSHKGAAVHVRAMIDAFSQLGHEVTLIAPRLGPNDGPEPAARLVHVPLPRIEKNDLAPDALREHQAVTYRPVFLQAASRELAHGNFDFIYERYSLWSDAGAHLARMTGLPLVLEVNSPLRQEAATFRGLHDHALAARIEAEQLRAAHTVVVVSEALARYVIAQGASPDRVLTLPNGVDPRRFHPLVRGGRVRQRYGLKDKIVIGFVGRARPWHDLDVLLAAFASLHSESDRYRLLLVGEMPARVIAEIARLGLENAVILTGPTPHEEVPTYIAAMNVAVSTHAALPDFYFSPLKLFEYMACARPVVAAEVGQPATLIRPGENGMLYQPGNAASLADAIRFLVSDPAQARRMAWRAAKEVHARFTWQRNAEAVLERIAPPPLVMNLPPVKKRIQPPVFDEKLRDRLYRATRPDLIAPALAKLPPFKHGPYQLERVKGIKVLKYKPRRRCVLRYSILARHRVSGEPVKLVWVGKVFRDERGRRLHRLHEALIRHGFGPDAPDRIHIPQSLGYEPRTRMQVQSFEPGRTLIGLAGKEEDISEYVAMAARGIAKLHQTVAPAYELQHEMRWWTILDELHTLEKNMAELTARRPHDATHLVRLFEILRYQAADTPQPLGPMPVHRDFYYSQLLFHNGHLTIIDLDLYAWGDPAIDLANFTAHLAMLGLNPLTGEQRFTREIDLFLTEYEQAAQPESTFWARYRFYEAASMLRLLNIVTTRPMWRNHYPYLMRRAESLLLGVEV